jgi:hypothetical protein
MRSGKGRCSWGSFSRMVLLLDGQDEAAIEKGAQELTAFIAGFADPNAMITYVRRLIKVAKHTPGLEDEYQNASFLSELVNLGRTYAAIDPVDDSESGAIEFFLHTIWTAQSVEAIEQGITDVTVQNMN